MGDRRRTICKGCGAHRDDVGELSWTGLCGVCGVVRVNENATAIHEKRGAEFRRWRRSMAACVGGVLLDDVRDGA